MSCTFVAQPADYSPPNESVIILVNDDTGAVFVDQEMMHSQSSGTLNVVRLCGGKDPVDVNMTVEEICPTAFHEKLNLTDIVATLNKKTTATKKEDVNTAENMNEQVKEMSTANAEPLKTVTENEEPANIVSEPANVIVSDLPIQDFSEVVSSKDNLPEASVVLPDYSSVEDVIESVIENSRNLLITEPAAASPVVAKEKRKLNKTEGGNKILKVEVERTAEEKKPQSRLSALRQEMQEKIQTIEPLKKEATPKSNFKLKLQLKRVSTPVVPSPAAEPVKTPQHKIEAQNTPESLKNEESDGRRPKRDRKVPKHLLQDFEQFEGTPDYLKKLITSSTTHSPLNQTLENAQTPVRRLSESTPAPIDEPKTVVSEESISDDDPTKLWCICRKPHNNRFMICCDKCEDWFHGHCVGVTRAMGRQLEENGLEWICPTCVQQENQKGVSQTAEEIGQAEAESFEPKVAAKKQSCVISSCKKDAKLGSIYCSDSCITSHVNDSLTLISKEIANHKTTDQTPKLKDSVEFSKLMSQVTPTSTKSKAIKKQSHSLSDDMTVPVKDSESGKIIEGPEAPKVSNIKTWLKKNPTFEIVRPSPRPQPSPQPAVQVSSPRKEAQKQTKPLKPLTGDDAMRSNARIALKEALVFRCRDCEEVQMTEDQAARAATDIEKALYKFFDKDVGTKYKAKYRSLLFNIRDLKNEVLFRKIAQNQIKPGDLVKMSADELASKELAEWRQQETKHQIEVIRKTELELGSTLKKYHVVKTHKGEEVIEESVNLKPAEEPEAAESLSLMLQDTTQKHRSHLFDLNCRICSGQVREEDVFPPDPANKDKEKAKNKAREVNRNSKDQGEKKTNKEENKSKEKEIEEVKQGIAALEEPSSTANVKITAAEESSYCPAVLWEGAVKSWEVGDFRVQAFEVSPNGHLDDARIPGSIEVIGRIRPPTLWDYINQNRKAGTRDIVLINMRPVEEADHTNFNTFLAHMHNSSRCGVIGSVSKLVKDFYVVPIPRGSEIPQTLAALAPATPALQSVGEGLLIGVVIRTKIQGPVTTSVTTKPVAQPRVDQVPGQGVTYVPTCRAGSKRSLLDKDVANGAAKKSKTVSEISQGLVGSSLLEQKAILDELNRKIEEQKKQLISMTAQLGNAAASAIVIPDLVLPGSGSLNAVGSDPTGNLQEILGAIEKKEQELKKLSLLIEKDPIVEKFGKLTEEYPESAKDVDMRKIFASPNSMKQLNVDDCIRKREADSGLDIVSNIPLPPQSPS